MAAPLLSFEDLSFLNPSLVPFHIAIIPDGNRRWSRKQELSVQQGHSEGADILMDTLRAAKQIGVKVLTFYVFSTENWSRLPDEVAGLMALIEAYLLNEIGTMQEEGVCFHTIGNLEPLPDTLQKAVLKAKTETAANNKIDLILALNYGARDEMVRACKKIIDKISSGKLVKEQVTEQVISEHLDTYLWPEPDLLIRTSGERRLSNFLLWQLSYAEVYVTPVLWPDFRPHHLIEAVCDFQKRQRRLGGDK